MSEELQQILNGLHEVMKQASEQSYNKEAIAWLSSNFNLLSRDGEEMTVLKAENEKLASELQAAKTSRSMHRSVPKMTEAIEMGIDAEGNPIQLQGEVLQDVEQTNEFMKRAQVSRQVNDNQKIKKLADQVRGKMPAAGSNPHIITANQINEVDPASIEEMEAMLDGGLAPSISSGLSSNPYDNDDALDPIAEAFARQGESRQGNASGGYSAKDVAALQRLQMKSQNAKKELATGGAIGRISRSG